MTVYAPRVCFAVIGVIMAGSGQVVGRGVRGGNGVGWNFGPVRRRTRVVSSPGRELEQGPDHRPLPSAESKWGVVEEERSHLRDRCLDEVFSPISAPPRGSCLSLRSFPVDQRLAAAVPSSNVCLTLF